LKIHVSLFVVAIITLAFVSIYDLNYLNYRFPIPYAGWRTITWKDFRGLRHPDINVEGESRIAFIWSQFDLEVDKDHFTITSYFHPSRSYVYSKNTSDKNLFQHEMYHFHITEVSARLFRKKLFETDRENKRIDVSLLFEIYRSKADSMQNAYDQETNHSFRLGKQRAWQQRIDSLLIELKEFQDPVIVRKNI
jgi:hypothetical protein